AKARLAEARNSVVNPAVPTPTEAYWISTASVVTGQPGLAISLLRNARPRGAWLWFYFQGPELDEFRKLPEVAAVLEDADPRRPVTR
ncbi:MAG TPA: hypothetical protein VFX40_04060, partial [Gemmatimonadaceae bacterium]|nr:hypothetical protein [Gemmatimonadaceae bacterium]